MYVLKINDDDDDDKYVQIIVNKHFLKNRTDF